MSSENKAAKKIRKKARTCRQCGAPITSELCPYCGTVTGLDTGSTAMEYPEIECSEATLNFWNTAFPGIFAVSFGWFGFYMPVFFYKIGEIEELWTLLFFIPFAAVGIGASVMVIKKLWAFTSVRLFGKDLEGKVYGYMDDNVLLNGNPAQVCKILVHTKKGPRFIMYQLGDIKRPYKVNSQLDLKVYKDRFAIVNRHRYDAWE